MEGLARAVLGETIIPIRDDEDRRLYLDRLAECRSRYGFGLLAFCLMPNHVHLAIARGEVPLSKIMLALHFYYSQKFNWRHERVGHLFQGRYKAYLVEHERYLEALVRYIHLNPVKAGIVERPDAFPWSSDRYYRTGDVASRDDDGYITCVGRTDDLFKASDYRISPFELESVLMEHEAVAEAAVVPSPDPMRLAVPKAYVTLAAGHEPSKDTAFAIMRFAREHLAPYKRVRRLEFGELPKTISGKIRRVQLRDDEHSRLTGTAVATARAPLEFWEEDFPELKR